MGLVKHSKSARRKKICKRIRQKINGIAERPRLSLYKSNKHIYAQLIDDDKGYTIASASSISLKKNTNATIQQAKEIGMLLAERAQSQGILKVVFDRSGYIYHGQVKALAEGAREKGLQF